MICALNPQTIYECMRFFFCSRFILQCVVCNVSAWASGTTYCCYPWLVLKTFPCYFLHLATWEASEAAGAVQPAIHTAPERDTHSAIFSMLFVRMWHMAQHVHIHTHNERKQQYKVKLSNFRIHQPTTPSHHIRMGPIRFYRPLNTKPTLFLLT